MKTSTILLSITLAFKTIYSKAIDNNYYDITNQTNDIKVDKSYEVVKIDNCSYKFHCSEEKKECDGYKNDINFACNALSNAFEFYQPISFEVYIDDSTGKYGRSGSLASSMDVNYVPLRTSNDKSLPPYLFPQALAKQLNINKQPKYKENDFSLLLNNCSTLNCKGNELRTIIIHEMLHGLGFSSEAEVIKLTDNKEEAQKSIIAFNENDNYAFTTRIIPSFNKTLMDITKSEEYMDQLYNSKITNFLPFSIFDKYLVSLKSGERILKNIPFYYEEANEKCFPEGSFSLTVNVANNSYLNKCIRNLSSETQKIVNRIIKDHFFDMNTLAIETYDGEKVPLQTIIKTYTYGSSVHHMNSPLDNEFFRRVLKNGYNSESVKEMHDPNTERFKEEYILKYYDDNFVMYASDEDNFTVEEMLEKLPNNKKHPLIGNGIIKIMVTLGWTQKGVTRSNHVYYLDETISIPDSEIFKYKLKKLYEIKNLNN